MLILKLIKLGEFAFFSLKCMRLRFATLLQPLLRVSPLHYDRGQQVAHNGLSYWVTRGTRSPLYVIGDGALRRGLFTGIEFHPAQRPVERAPA